MSSSILLPRTRRDFCVLGALAVSSAASAQSSIGSPPTDWPRKPLRIVVGFGGGSSPDIVARTIADPLSRAIGQPVLVENRPGASGNIAAGVVAQATDQHTIGMLINGNLTIAKLLNPATPYDPGRDLAPISLICTAPLVLTVPLDAPGTNGRIFFQAARAAGSRWSYGSPGMGTVGHLGMEVLKSRSGIAPVHVPYMGNPQVVTALMARELNLALLPPGLADVQIRAGKLRAVGVTSRERNGLVPDIATLAESGMDDFELEVWTAAAAPSSLPGPIVGRLSALIGEIANSPEVKQKLFQNGYLAVGSTPDQLAARMKTDTALLGRIIQEQGVRIE